MSETDAAQGAARAAPKTHRNNRTVILVSHGFQSQYESGYANALAGHGVEVVLIGSDNTNPARLRRDVRLVNLRGSQSESRSTAAKALNMLAYHAKLLWFLLRRRGCMVHVIGVFRYPIAMGIFENLAFRVLARRFLITVHNILPHNAQTRLNRILYRYIYATAHHLLVHTDKMKDRLAYELGVQPDRVAVMHHGLNEIPALDAGLRARGRESLGIPDDATALLFFGYVSHYKGLDILLRAFDELDGRYWLVIAGRHAPEEPAYKAEIAGLIAANKNRDRIVHRDGFVADTDVARYFHTADTLVMPYRHIDQSGVLLLAQSYGLPVVAFDVGSLADYLGCDDGLIVSAPTHEALRIGLQSFQRSRSRYRRDAIQRRAARFLWDQTVRPILPLYCAKPEDDAAHTAASRP